MANSDLDLLFYEGDTHTGQFTVSTKNDDGSKTPTDLTGLVVEIVLKPDVSELDSAGTTLSTEGTTPAITITDAVGGAGTVKYPASLTSSPGSSKFVKLRLVNSAGEVSTVAYGKYGVTDL